jgi:hypothetical protein
MKKTELKEVLDSQRYFLVALQMYLLKLGLFPSQYDLLEMNLDYLWNTTEVIGQSLKIELLNMEEIIRHGKEMNALNQMYSMEIHDKNSIN